MFLHPARVRPLGKPLELYFQRMLLSKGSALVRCRCVFVFKTLDNLFALSFFICVCAVVPLSHTDLLFLSLCVSCVMCYTYFSLTLYSLHLSLLSVGTPKSQSLVLKFEFIVTLDSKKTAEKNQLQQWEGPTIARNKVYTCEDRQLYTFVTILLNTAIMLQPKNLFRILL